MPRAAKPEGLRILDYFNSAELGEAKVIASLAMETVNRRYQQKINEVGGNPAPKVIQRKTRKVAPVAAAAPSTQEAVS